MHESITFELFIMIINLLSKTVDNNCSVNLIFDFQSLRSLIALEIKRRAACKEFILLVERRDKRWTPLEPVPIHLTEILSQIKTRLEDFFFPDKFLFK
ncbi:hypothetical protein DN068_18455 [Taibaiella soli]|uniref:Uncharacterized protein n=1 Tax=Taibaiella soli TaxID=1649169 RepID=A0A2W2A7P9_9BACT|nr:hypothetical protein DN068_18455 [Taibaiella soli]